MGEEGSLSASHLLILSLNDDTDDGGFTANLPSDFVVDCLTVADCSEAID